MAQNKCIRFYLNLRNTAHVWATEFKAISWLPTKHRVDQNICVNMMKFVNGTAEAYANEIFHPASGVATGWTGVDMSTPVFPEFDFLISRNPLKKLWGGVDVR